jgi:hypothetical protein
MQMLVTDLLAYTRSLEGGDEGQAIADGNDAISEVLSNLRIA